MDRNLAAIGVGGVDQRACLILEHTGGQARARIDPAGGREFDHIGAPANLTAHRAAAIIDPIAEVFGADHRSHLVSQADPAIHVPAAGRD